MRPTPTNFARSLSGCLLHLTLAVSLVAGCGPKDGKLESFSEEQLATDPVANFRLGVQLLEQPGKGGAVDYETAYRRFRDAAELGGSAKAHFNAGWVAEVLNRPEDAERHYARAFEADPGYRPAMFSYARVLSSNDKGGEAAAIYRTYLESQPDDLEVRNELVVALAAAGAFDEAEQEAAEILRRDPDNVQVYRNLSGMYHAQGSFGMSQLTIDKALSLQEGDAGTYNNRGVTYLLQGDTPAAIDQFQTAIKLDPDHFEANTNLGYIALTSGDYTLAHTALAKAVEARPQSVEARLGLAAAARGTADFERADALYREIILADPDLAAAYFNASTLHEVYTKDFDKALSYLESYVDAMSGSIGPDHEVFARMERVRATQAEEERRKAEEAEKKRLEEERRQRNEALLATMATEITAFEAKVTANAECLGPVAEEAAMLIEQAKMVIESQDASMAPDIQSMLTDYYGPMVDETLTTCP